MKKDNIPIIFIHKTNLKGDLYFLKYTLDIAAKTNKNKELYFLGDNLNKEYPINNGWEFYNINEFSNSEQIETFEKVYKYIGSPKHGREEWVKFVFKRWFIINNFIKEKKIEKFWTFDSDNLILTDLSLQEYKFKDYDCTEQCNGMCMNGFINNSNVVDKYVNKINELFLREEYLNQVIEEIGNNSWAFTEMKAYHTYKEEEKIKSIPLNTIIDNETFDECLCQEHDMEMTNNNKLINKIFDIFRLSKFHRQVKKIYFENGHIFEKSLNSNNLIKINTINMSWLSLGYYKKIYNYIISNL